MHVLNVSLKHVVGGTPQVCLDYTNALRTQGLQVTTVTKKADPFSAAHQEAGANLVHAKFAGKFGSYDLFSLVYFINLIRKLKPDVIIAHDGRGVKICKIASLGRIPVVDVNHGRPVRQSSNTDGTIVINPKQLERTQIDLAGKKNISYIPNMVDIRDVARPQELAAWQEVPVIGAMGRMVNEKAFDVLLDALAILKKHGLKFKAVIGGDGEKHSKLESQLLKNNLQDNVKLLGWIDNPEEFYKNIDIFCLSSRQEACPKVLLEAMKYSLPVVVTDAEGPVDIIKDGFDGIMVQKDNPEKLAEGLKQMLENRELAKSYANNAYEKIKNMYSVPVIGERLHKMLEQVVKTFKRERI